MKLDYSDLGRTVKIYFHKSGKTFTGYITEIFPPDEVYNGMRAMVVIPNSPYGGVFKGHYLSPLKKVPCVECAQWVPGTQGGGAYCEIKQHFTNADYCPVEQIITEEWEDRRDQLSKGNYEF